MNVCAESSGNPTNNVCLLNESMSIQTFVTTDVVNAVVDEKS